MRMRNVRNVRYAYDLLDKFKNVLIWHIKFNMVTYIFILKVRKGHMRSMEVEIRLSLHELLLKH